MPWLGHRVFLKLLLLFFILPSGQLIGAFPIRCGFGSLLGKSTKNRGSINKSFVKISSLKPRLLILQILFNLCRPSVIFHQISVLLPKLFVGHTNGEVIRKDFVEFSCVSKKGGWALIAAAPLVIGKAVAYQPAFQLRFPSLSSCCSGSSRRLSRGSLYISTRAEISSSL